MPSVIDKDEIKKKCQIFTPVEIAKKMLNMVNYNENIYDKTILENSCGDGVILALIVERYIIDAIRNKFPQEKIKEGLEKNILAYELDKNLVSECFKKLDEIAKNYKITNVKWNIKCEDFLSSEKNITFDFIVGNPPYIAYPDLPQETQNYLKNTFEVCKKGKFDYCYAFIEKSYLQLANNGKLIYIIPSNIFKNVFAKNLRNLILDDLDGIMDYPIDKVFENVLVSPAIIKIIKGHKTPTFQYTICQKSKKNNEIEEDSRIIEKETLSDKKWTFNSIIIKNGTRLGDHFRVSSSIATLCNEAFVVKGGMIECDYYEIDGEKIELSLLKKSTSPKSKKYSKLDEYIIFPYKFINDKLQHYTENEMDQLFPYGIKYLQKFKEKLNKRDSDKSAKWFEYGRSQAIQNMNQDKILVSSIISDCTKAYFLSKDEIPYSGLYIIPSSKMLSLEELLIQLNSLSFKKHILNIGICVSGTSKRVTPDDIEEYFF